ncbi:MAG: diphosphate--fructose-6-phosphate 1-phosphotransferase [Lacrimispora sp.]|uniref:diphosphate--fructose-6-phosphate 1-phosphotransferase n=1 Tax=Lacrimispora sp. TaxID=2719234 RepID=UPI0039E389AB
MKKNVLVVHGGGPTPVMNASLYGVVQEAKRHGDIGAVYGAMGGMEGILKEDLVDLMAIDENELKKLLSTPGSAIGSSRFPLTEEQYEEMAKIIGKYGISYLLPNGGNGTMDTCGRINRACVALGNTDVKVVGIPKTIDNDIAITDHTPGFGSAARYMAGTVKEIAEDVRSLPIHVCVIEALGRNSGWITASSVLAREKAGDAPHLIYTPERPFCQEEFLEDVKKLYDELGGVVVVVSEGLKGKDGNPIVEPIFKTERAIYYGDVSTHLANLVVKELGIKARSEKPGLAGRSSIAWQSEVDRDEAMETGEMALRLAILGKSGIMVGIERVETQDQSYETRFIEIPIDQVMMYEKTLPVEYINGRGNDVTEAFSKWCRPLVGEKLQSFINIKDIRREKQI